MSSSAQLGALFIDEASEFIETVKLAPISTEQATALAAALDVADHISFVNRGSIQYLRPLPEQQRTDALYWTLFGQLAADAKVNREDDPEGWYKEYIQALRGVGMRSNNWSRHSASGSEAGPSVDACVLRYLMPYLSPSARDEFPRTIRSLRTETNMKSLSIFNSSSANSSSANFQVSDGTVDRYLNLTIHVGFLDFKTNQDIKSVLFWQWTNRNFTFYYSQDTLTLSKKFADMFRERLYERVANHVAANINDIALA